MIKISRYEDFSVKDLSLGAANAEVTAAVAEIMENVKNKGDEALFYYTRKFDGVELQSFAVTEEEFEKALKETDAEFVSVLKKAAENIRRFHGEQKRQGFSVKSENGALIGQRIIPIEKAGLYVPGGTAAYPSTVLMDAIPAKIAGCEEVVMVTPPKKDGTVAPAILAAAKIAGVDKVYKVGGAQAIAALAYGTESIPRVYKIVGPGNAFVAEAKKQAFGQVSIDMIAGPSEILIVADGGARADFVAADMLAQAEHDKNARAILVTDSQSLANSVKEELERQCDKLERAEIARASIEKNGRIILVKDMAQALEAANAVAPEHLELCVRDAFSYLEKVKNAGSVFIGEYCPEALGDYIAGANHTLPTSGTARFSSPLSVDDFIKKSQYIYYPDGAFNEVYKDVKRFADEEGLTAHGKSAAIRFEKI